MKSGRGFVLVTVLLLTLATWALLAAMLTTAFLHYRLALGPSVVPWRARRRSERWPST
jgi:hypothetical protein